MGCGASKNAVDTADAPAPRTQARGGKAAGSGQAAQSSGGGGAKSSAGAGKTGGSSKMPREGEGKPTSPPQKPVAFEVVLGENKEPSRKPNLGIARIESPRLTKDDLAEKQRLAEQRRVVCVCVCVCVCVRVCVCVCVCVCVTMMMMMMMMMMVMVMMNMT
jgi:hypothetical protein